MADDSRVDDSREEHRMFVKLNDSNLVLARSIVNESIPGVKKKEGILTRKTHEESYTSTLYVVLEHYGMTPISRIKPRVRFKRSGYDGLSSSNPILFPPDSVVNFVELKKPENKPKPDSLEDIFCDGPVLQQLADDPALRLVSQLDTFLMQPPVKTKSKVMGNEDGRKGIPFLDFLEALNKPDKSEKIFREYKHGVEFAKDLRQAIEPFIGLEFKFGVYSRYERRDCVLIGDKDGYRTTFDPSTVLGWVRRLDDFHQLQPLCHEHGTRWEHKIDLDYLDKSSQRIITDHLKVLRLEYLINRTISKSQTALTLLADWKENQLNLVNDIPGFTLRAEIKQPTNKFSDVRERKRLRAVFSGNYKLLDDDIVERHLNLAKGENADLVYVLDNATLMLGQKPLAESVEGITFIKEPLYTHEIVYSAADLRERMPSSFDRCYCEQTDEGGYSILSQKTGRCYTISLSHRKIGNIKDGKTIRDRTDDYVSIKYLGIKPAMFKGEDISHVYAEIKEITDFLKEHGIIG